MKRQFEAWKKTIYHEYDENKHDDYLSQRYYKTKKQDDFSTNSHFHHPNADSGPLRGPAQNPEHHQNRRHRRYSVHMSENERDEDKAYAIRLAFVFFFGTSLFTYLRYNIAAKKERAQNLYHEKTERLIYIDRQAVEDMQLTHEDLVEMAK